MEQYHLQYHNQSFLVISDHLIVCALVKTPPPKGGVFYAPIKNPDL